MRRHQMTLISDFYKQAHAEQYPKGMNFIASYFTPRMSRLKEENSLIVFGVQGFIKDYLIERFNDTFFNVPVEEIIKEYERVIRHTLSSNYCEPNKIASLHSLGYLPIEIKSLPEGTKCPIKVPCIEITSTKEGFEWVVQFIESIMSCQLWYPMTIANQAYKYRKIVNNYYNQTADDAIPRYTAISEFGFRGAQGQEGAVLASSAFLTSFAKTATIPAILYLEDYYNGILENGSIAGGMISTEHSVMCSNYAVDTDEQTFVKRLLTEIYPSENVSVVADSYDYWNMIETILSSEDIKAIIETRAGTLFVRGDSGDPVDIICGTKDIDNTNRTPAMKGTVESLWEKFGGYINSKGYKVLNNSIRVIYGDSITPEKSERIYKRLMDKGFAANNVALGAGSFSMQCAEENGQIKPFTRDTYGIAIKATYVEVNGKPIEVFKNPITDTGNFKKSQKGMCYVHYDKNGSIVVTDGYTRKSMPKEENLLQSVFKDGKIYNEVSIYDVRNTLHNNKF